MMMPYTISVEADKTVHKWTLLYLCTIQTMRYNILEKARGEICVLFPFCAGERHDADLSKPGQSAEKSELPPIR